MKKEEFSIRRARKSRFSRGADEGGAGFDITTPKNESAMGKEKGFALTSIRAREMRRFLEHHGYVVEPGQHKHLKLRHDKYAEVLLPLRPGDNLSFVAIKQIARAMGLTPDQLTAAVK